MQGFRNMLDINGDPSVKAEITDVAQALECIDYDPARKSIFYLLKYTTQGIFLTVLRTIPEHKPDHLAAWIFLPYRLNITDLEISDILETIVKAVNQPKISSEAMAEIRSTFDRQYPTVDSAGAIAPSSGKHYAHRFFGGNTGYTLDDLIGKKRYQTLYLKYAGVILAERHEAKAIYGADLTEDPLEQMVKLLPPKSDNSAYTPTIFGERFDKPYLVPLMGTVEVVWQSPGNTDFRQSIIVSRPNMQPESILPPMGTAPIQSKPSTEAPKPQPARPVDLPQPVKPTQAPHPVDPMQSPTMERESQPTPRQTIVPRPAPTKKPKTDSASTESKPLRIPTDKIIWGVIGFALGVIVTMACMCDRIQSPAPVEPPAAQPPAQTADTTAIQPAPVPATPAPTSDQATAPATAPKPATAAAKPTEKPAAAPTPKPVAGRTLTDAIKYLDTHDTWSKAALESYPDLKGLFDDMNNLQKKKLAKDWGKKLSASKRFQMVVTHTEYNSKTPKLPAGQTKFLKDDAPREIFVKRYLNTIDP